MHILYARLLDIVKNLYPDTGDSIALTFGLPPKPELGDIAIWVFWLSKNIGVNPAELANQIAIEISHSQNENTKGISANAMGWYVNVRFSDSSLVELLLWCSTPYDTSVNASKTVIIDYFGANIGKPLHIWHLCAPSIGQVIINAYRHRGYTTIGDMHQGDWGSFFGKLIVGYHMFGSAPALEHDAVEHLLEVYVKLTAAEETDPTIADAYREAFKKLSLWDAEMVSLWLDFTKKTISEALELGKQLLVFPDVMIWEAFYEGLGLPTLGDYPKLEVRMSDVVAELVNLGIATKNEDGSVGIVFDEATKLPSCILAKRDGTHGYLASDLAGIRYRMTNGWNPEHIIYCVDVRQELHFRQLFEVTRWWIEKSDWGKKLITVPKFTQAKNGFIKLKDGAMSTRSGKIIRLQSLIDEGISRVDALLAKKGIILEIDNIRAIAIGAIKYSYLMSDREKDIVFDWDKALNFEWHSGPYIQYAYVRAKNILGKSGQDVTLPTSFSCNLSPFDKNLILLLAKKEEVIDSMLQSHKPHHLAMYAYELATTFSSFYVHTPKLLEEWDADLKAIRLSLVHQTVTTMAEAFKILAIPLPNKM